MNLYAIRDRMINYFIQPFAAPGDNDVMSAIATRINTQGDTDAISQAPHHFEIWKLASFSQETGNITPEKQFLADCSSLVRTGLRTTAENRPGTGTRQTLADGRRGPPGGAPPDRPGQIADQPEKPQAAAAATASPDPGM